MRRVIVICTLVILVVIVGFLCARPRSAYAQRQIGLVSVQRIDVAGKGIGSGAASESVSGSQVVGFSCVIAKDDDPVCFVATAN